MNTIKPLTEQEFFDTAAQHLLKQGRRAVSPSPPGEFAKPSCAYRAPDGAKCAIGCFITDEQYAWDMENKSVWALQEKFELPQFVGLSTLFGSVVENMQVLHDGTDPAEWRAGLLALGQKFKLNTDVLGAI